jgi:hypothetical protein
MLAYLSKDLVTVAEESVGSFHPGHPRSVRQEWQRGTTVDHLKWSGTQGGVEGGVVAVLRLGQPVHPRTGVVSCNTLQIHGNNLVYHLGLAVSLWVKGRAQA